MIAAVLATAIAVPLVKTAPDVAPQEASWKNVPSVTLPWNLQGHKAAAYATNAQIVSDGKYLYVRFDAKQNGSITATQHTNNAGYGTDDTVAIDLWPGGIDGFEYQFIANPIGTHYQYSSENSAYEPIWWSDGKLVSGGYVVTMKIPLGVMRGAAAGKPWRVQFSRTVESTGDVYVWSYDPNETDPTTSVYSGTMTGLVASAAPRPRARFALYTLGSIAGASAGGSTSRAGMDLSIPITATSSFYATIHPDYSNVELDQQSISPTAFRRYYQEVRPFFTQGQQVYNNFDCDLCNGIQTLYTPAIPTPRDGYAIEGTQGPVTYGAFDAVGDGRNDSAQALSLRTKNHDLFFSMQRVTVAMPGFKDDSVEAGLSFSDHKHLFAYFNYGDDKGTNVLDPSRAQLYDSGAGWSDPTTTFAMTYRKIGEYFNPSDGYVWHPDIAGWGAYVGHTFLFRPGAALRSASITAELDRYHDHTGELDQTDQGIGLDFLTRGLIDISAGTGSNYLRLPDGTFAPVTQNSYSVTFGSGAQNSSVNNGPQHGASATPTTVSYSTGRFGAGRLDGWSLSSTVRAGRRGLASFEIDDNTQHLDAGQRYTQWLERVSYTYQAGPNQSFALGVRRIIGTPPELDGVPVFQTGWNLSAAFHRTFGANELYAVYGDASAFSTVPQFIVKWIHYFGAAKGT